jgi:hypothetical protein
MAETAKAPVRGGDEIGFLGSRAQTAPVDAALARQKTNALVKAVLAFDGELGAQAHDEGTELVELYFQHADASLGHGTFEAFLDARWPLDRGVAYERMRVAKLCTREQAQRYGYTACVYALRIMRAMGIDDFKAFLRKPLRLHADDGGGTVKFPATVRELRSVLRALAVTEAAETTVDAGEQLRRYRAAVDALRASEPVIDELKPVVWADTRGAYVRVTASGPAQSKAAARLYQAIGRLAVPQR